MGLWSPWCLRTFPMVVLAALGPLWVSHRGAARGRALWQGHQAGAELLLRGMGLGTRRGVRDRAKQQQGCWPPPGQGASRGSSCRLGRGGRANSQRGNGTCFKGAEQLLLAAGVETGSAGLAAAPRGRWRAGCCPSHLRERSWGALAQRLWCPQENPNL